jgi:hypothetical protein
VVVLVLSGQSCSVLNSCERLPRCYHERLLSVGCPQALGAARATNHGAVGGGEGERTQHDGGRAQQQDRGRGHKHSYKL